LLVFNVPIIKKKLKCFLTIHLPQTHKASAKKAKKVKQPHLPTVLLRGVVKIANFL